MIIFLTLFFWGSIAYVVPRKEYKLFFLIASIAISILYIWFYPPEEYDLYRHYQIFEAAKEVPINELFKFSNSYMSSNSILNEYLSSSKVYAIFIGLLTRISWAHILPVLIGCIVYGLMSYRIYSIAQDENYKRIVMAIGFNFLLMRLDYRSISGIRNIVAYCIFAYLAYEDLVKKKNRTLCFIGYTLLCEVHLSVIVFIVLRILVFLCNRLTKNIIYFSVVTSFFSIDKIILIIDRHFSSISIMNALKQKVINYLGDSTRYSIKKTVFTMCIILVYFGIYFVCKKTRMKDKMKEYNILFELSLLYTMAAVLQYDIFIRNEMMLLFLIIPYLLLLLNDCIEFQRGGLIIYIRKLSSQNTMADILIILLMGTMLVSMLYYILLFYKPMDPFFIF